ncbi:MAG: hypothetical protein V1822_03980, partial [Candidatus Micrarchaeota archaeon]
GQLSYGAKYSLSPEYVPNSALIAIPWNRHDSGSATLITNDGQTVQGVWAASAQGEPQIQFLIKDFQESTKSFEVQVFPDSSYLAQKGQFASSPSQSSAKLDVSYYLQYGGLPECSQINIEVAETAGSQIENLQVSSDYAKVSAVKTNFVGTTKWSATLSDIPKNGSILLLVSYQANDSAQWISSTLSYIRQRAYGLNDNSALQMADSAQAAFNAGNADEAYSLISQLQKRISSQSIDNGASRAALESDISSASGFSNTLSNADASIFPDAQKWADDLSSAIEKSNGQMLASDFEGSRSTLRTKIASLNQKLQPEFSKLYSQLQQKASSVQYAASILDNSPTLLPYAAPLNDAQSCLSSSNYSCALLSLQSAYSPISQNYELSLNASLQMLASQDAKAQEEKSKAAKVSLEYDAYMDAIAQLASMAQLSMPPMSSKEAKSIQTNLAKTLSDYKPSAQPQTLDSALEQISKNAIALAGSDSQIQDASIRMQESNSDFKSLANSLLETARISVAQLSQNDASSSALPALNEDLASAQKMIDAENYADAISLSESISKRAAAAMPKTKDAQLPIEIIAITLILIIAASYFLFFKKPPKEENEPAETKILQKA